MGKRPPNLTVLGYAVRQLRTEQGMNARELASAAGVRLAVLEAIEAGRMDPTYEVLVSLARGCELGPAAIVLRAEEFAETLPIPTRGPARDRRRRQPTESRDEASIRFGRRVRELRRERGLTQDELARTSDVHLTDIGRYERGSRAPCLPTIVRIARGLEVPPSALLDQFTPHASEARAGDVSASR